MEIGRKNGAPLREVAIMPGRKQPHPFDPAKAERLDDPAREQWLPTDTLLALLDVREGDRVLDYGAGTGRYAIAVARRDPASSITAFDIQEPMLEIIRSRAAGQNLKNLAVAGPAESALAPKSFDRILGVHLLHEIDDEHLQHIRSLLAPGGVLLIVDWEQSAKRDVGPPPEHVHTVHEALLRMRRNGFRAEVVDSGAFPYHYTVRASAQPQT
jgi:ubiquinone/menaquinone biosynthesis C-methylase UbiE